MATDVGAVFRRQGNAFLSRMSRLQNLFAEDATDPFDPLWDETADETSDQMQAALTASMKAAFDAGVVAAAATSGSPFSRDLVSKDAIAYLEQHGAELVTALNDTTRTQLAGVLSTAMQEGWSYKQTAQTIASTFEGFSVDRAQLVAVYESALAYSEGQSAVARALQAGGHEMVKEWITVNDERVDLVCSENEGAGPIPFDDTFPSGDDMAPAHINCRCDVAVYPASES